MMRRMGLTQQEDLCWLSLSHQLNDKAWDIAASQERDHNNSRNKEECL